MKQSHLRSITVLAFVVSLLGGLGIETDNRATPPMWVGFFSFFMLPMVYIYMIFARTLINHSYSDSEKFSVHPFKRPDKFNELSGYVGIAGGIGITISTILVGQSISFESVFFFGSGISFLLGSHLAMKKNREA